MSDQYDHSLKRLIDAYDHAKAAEESVHDLVQKFVDIAVQLSNWKTQPIGFREDRADGSSSIPSTANQISLNEMPFLKPVAEAMRLYKLAVSEHHGAKSALPRDRVPESLRTLD